MSRRGADELAGFAGEWGGDGGGVAALPRLAGQDHGAGVDILMAQAGRRIGAFDEGAEGAGIDRVVAEKGREQDRRGPEDAPLDDDETARKIVGPAPEMHPAEDEMRGRAADIDADGGEFDVVEPPDAVGERLLLLLGEVAVRLDILVQPSRGGGVRNCVEWPRREVSHETQPSSGAS